MSLNNLSRRRFLTDMGFIGGALLLAAGTAMFTQGGHSQGEAPTPAEGTPEGTPEAPPPADPPGLPNVQHRPHAGEPNVVAPTGPEPPQHRPDPFQAPDHQRPLPGRVAVPRPTPDQAPLPGSMPAPPGRGTKP